MAVFAGCEVPEDLLYDVDHDVWVRLNPDGSATLGMTDFAQASCGKLVHIRFKAPGREFARGGSLATIESSKWVGPFRAPFAGRLLATNEAAFAGDILAANKDPYGAGWLVRMLPSEPVQLQTSMEAFEQYRLKIQQTGIQCYRCAG
ncbi:MAG: glycine cleavage system protein H [Chloroflexota bacterium]|nr:glycine cleavage system protein H [Chloroflexota bacterium]